VALRPRKAYPEKKYNLTMKQIKQIAKHLNKQPEPDEDVLWNEQMQAYLRKRRGKIP